MTLYLGADAQPHDIWRQKVDPVTRNPGLLTNVAGGKALIRSTDSNLFALVLPPIEPKRFRGIWHLVDRTGHMWVFPGGDSGEYISPYNVVGFADNDQKIIAYDTSRLFSLPVSAVKTDANKANK